MSIYNNLAAKTNSFSEKDIFNLYMKAKEEGQRIVEMEYLFLEEPFCGILYASDVINDRWSELESVIISLGESDLAWEYIRKVVKARWPEAEPLISKCGWTACKYAEHIIQGRWPEGEEAISKINYCTYTYAVAVLKRRWVEQEDQILADMYRINYIAHFGIKEFKANWKKEGF